jgi:ABC-type Na+ efflux pump permease subunit
MTFMTQLRKEIMEQFRTRRFLIVFIVLLVGHAFPPDGEIHR